MSRPLKPCGTYAAYARHLRNNEKPCDPCTAANRQRQSDAPSGRNAYQSAMDKELRKDPPKILWRKRRGGVFVAVSVHDPHAERGTNRPQVYEPIAPECTNPDLLTAARTEI
jgi:hypothetical protein